jgi:hypothetical protein
MSIIEIQREPDRDMAISLPVHVQHENPHVIIDADGNEVATCGNAWATSMPREQRIKMLIDAEAIAKEIVTALNAQMDDADAGEHPPLPYLLVALED